MTKPTTRTKLPAAPRRLSREAAELWRSTVAYLSRNGRLEAVDGAVIEGFCMAVCRQRLLQAGIDATGVLGPDGKPNPLLRSTEAVAASVKNFAITLGLTPASRKAMPAKPPKSKEANPWAGVL